MALPEDFSSVKEYFQDCVEFLYSNAWIFEHANVNIVSHKVFKRFPEGFAKYFLTVGNTEINKFPFVHKPMAIQCQKLKKFRNSVNRLIPKLFYEEYPAILSSGHIKKPIPKNIKLKKNYEVERLSELICKICHKKTDCLVDFGCGVGHLCEALYNRETEVPILGLDRDADRVDKARKRRDQKLKNKAKGMIKYQQHEISSDGYYTREFLKKHTRELLNQFYKPPKEIRIGIIGLHACGDLSAEAIDIFLDTPNITRMVMMPCCYHKMESFEYGIIPNFPISSMLTRIASKYRKFEKRFHLPFLRLACQRSVSTWTDTSAEEHAFHGEQMYYRALAEGVICRGEEMVAQLKPLSRVEVAKSGLPQDFFTFANHWQMYNEDLESLRWTSWHQGRFYSLNRRYGSVRGPRLAEGLTCLQVTLQRVCENLVLLDRITHMKVYANLKEIDLKVRYEKIFDDKLSPRCFVLIAEKAI